VLGADFRYWCKWRWFGLVVGFVEGGILVGEHWVFCLCLYVVFGCVGCVLGGGLGVWGLVGCVRLVWGWARSAGVRVGGGGGLMRGDGVWGVVLDGFRWCFGVGWWVFGWW